MWTVTARAGQRVVIDMESDDVDAYLRVLRNDGTPIANDDDGGSGSNARVEFRAPYGGDYLVIATSFEEGEVGGYGVKVAVAGQSGAFCAALHWAAAQSGNGRVIKVLLHRGADPVAESKDGRTPLHSATEVPCRTACAPHGSRLQRRQHTSRTSTMCPETNQQCRGGRSCPGAFCSAHFVWVARCPSPALEGRERNHHMKHHNLKW